MVRCTISTASTAPDVASSPNPTCRPGIHPLSEQVPRDADRLGSWLRTPDRRQNSQTDSGTRRRGQLRMAAVLPGGMPVSRNRDGQGRINTPAVGISSSSALPIAGGLVVHHVRGLNFAGQPQREGVSSTPAARNKKERSNSSTSSWIQPCILGSGVAPTGGVAAGDVQTEDVLLRDRRLAWARGLLLARTSFTPAEPPPVVPPELPVLVAGSVLHDLLVSMGNQRHTNGGGDVCGVTDPPQPASGDVNHPASRRRSVVGT